MLRINRSAFVSLLLKSFACIFILVSLVSCSQLNISRKSNEKKLELLRDKVTKWNQFRIDGVLEINIKQFQVRKTAIIRKNDEAIRMDLIDSGLLNIRPVPFLTVYYDSVLVVYSETIPLLEDMIDEKELASFELFELISKILYHEDEIINKGYCEIDSVLFVFDKDYNLNTINRKDVKVNINYDIGNNPQSIELFRRDEKVANIKIDRISWGNVSVDPVKALNERNL